jgi:hypothetical protein
MSFFGVGHGDLRDEGVAKLTERKKCARDCAEWIDEGLVMDDLGGVILVD